MEEGSPPSRPPPSQSFKSGQVRSVEMSGILPISVFLFPLLLVVELRFPPLAMVSAMSLRPGYYSETCPGAEYTVRDVIRKSMAKEVRSGASVMRLQFHDCLVNGCDASLLLDDTPSMLGEKTGLSNVNSLRSFEVIDDAKAELEKICPQTVSCADIVIMAARDAVALSGGPDWQVKLGRKDSLTASLEDTNEIMPSPRSNASYLINLFQRFNLTVKDLVALSGSHSIGKGRCFSIVYRLYNQSGTGEPDPTIDPDYREKLNKLCPADDVDDGNAGNVTGDLDGTPTVFDNRYYKDLIKGRGFLNSDQTLYTYQETRGWVLRFSESEKEFFKAFVEGMIKMGDLLLPDHHLPGEIRRNCRVVNNPTPTPSPDIGADDDEIRSI